MSTGALFINPCIPLHVSEEMHEHTLKYSGSVKHAHTDSYAQSVPDSGMFTLSVGLQQMTIFHDGLI